MRWQAAALVVYPELIQRFSYEGAGVMLLSQAPSTQLCTCKGATLPLARFEAGPVVQRASN